MDTNQIVTKVRAEIMLAYADGQPIQFSNKCSTSWSECTNPIWDWASFDYRVKPQQVVGWGVLDSSGNLVNWFSTEKAANCYRVGTSYRVVKFVEEVNK